MIDVYLVFDFAHGTSAELFTRVCMAQLCAPLSCKPVTDAWVRVRVSVWCVCYMRVGFCH